MVNPIQEFLEKKIAVQTGLKHAIEFMNFMIDHGFEWLSRQEHTGKEDMDLLRRRYRNNPDDICIGHRKVTSPICTPSIGHSSVGAAHIAGYEIVSYDDFMKQYLLFASHSDLSDIDSVI